MGLSKEEMAQFIEDARLGKQTREAREAKEVKPDADPKTWRDMPKEELDKRLKEGVDVALSTGQVFKFKTTSENPFAAAKAKRFRRRG